FAVYLLVNWLPTVVMMGGWEMSTAIHTITVFNFGALLGGLLMGWLIDHVGPHRVLILAYFSGACALFAASLTQQWVLGLFFTFFVVGAGIIGTQMCAMVLAAQAYPTHIRSTGLGMASAVGRAGAVM